MDALALDESVTAGPGAETRQSLQLDLAFGPGPRGTRLLRKRVRYPYAVMKPLRLPDRAPGTATVILQSASGGLFAGEQLGQRIETAPGAQAEVTTQSAAVVHDMPDGRPAAQTIGLDAGPDSRLAYLPKPAILFPQSRLMQRIDLRLGPGARVSLADGFLMHDPDGAGQPFGLYDNAVQVRDERGRLLAADRARVTGADVARGFAGITGRYRAFGTLYLLGAGDIEDRLDALRRLAEAQPNLLAGSGRLPNQAGTVLRLAAADGGDLYRFFELAAPVLSSRLDS